MNPIAFSIFGLPIRWYGILISIGMIIGIFLAGYSCRKKNLNYDSMMDMVLIALPLAILGARLYYVLFNIGEYIKNPADIFNIRQGGLAIHGGVIFALAGAYIYARKKGLNFIKYADAAAPSIIIGQAIGRWGNFFNQEAHGGPVSYEFISKFPKFIQNGMFIDGAYYHPTFLYESLWNLVVFVVLLLILNKSRRDGSTFFAYVGLYSIGRFIIEGLRTDSLMIGPLRVAQLVSLSGVFIWLIYIYLVYFRKKKIL